MSAKLRKTAPPHREAKAGPGESLSPWFRNKGVIAVVTVALVCAGYRILTFVPQPLDSPSSLRPILYSWYLRFVAHYASIDLARRAWNSYCVLSLLIPAILATANYLHEEQILRAPARLAGLVTSRTLLFVSIAASLFAFRFPVLLAGELNVDETQFLVTAQKLFKDPVFFRSVDCGTTGPVNIFPLMLPAALGISPDYASGRIVGLLIVLASIFVMHRVFSLIMADRFARLAILPMAGWFAVLKDKDLVHYSSEYPSLLLTALAIYAAVKTFRKPESYAWTMAGLGFLLAAAWFAKWQALPGILCITAIALARVHWPGSVVASGSRPYLFWGCGLAPLFLLNLIVCYATGVLYDFWMDFVVANLSYVAKGYGFTALGFIRFLFQLSEIRWMAICLLAILAVYVLRSLRRRKDHAGTEVIRWVGVLTAAGLLAAITALYIPRRPHTHYLVFLIIPLTMAMAWPIVKFSADRNARLWPFALAFVMVIVSCQIVQAYAPAQISYVFPASVRAPESKFIASVVPPGGEISIWGWDARPYAGSGRTPATRDTNMANFFRGDERIDRYYRERYVKDLDRHPAYLFIDAHVTSPMQLPGFESVPSIASYIQSHYLYLKSAYGQSYYLRRDIALTP